MEGDVGFVGIDEVEFEGDGVAAVELGSELGPALFGAEGEDVAGRGVEVLAAGGADEEGIGAVEGDIDGFADVEDAEGKEADAVTVGIGFLEEQFGEGDGRVGGEEEFDIDGEGAGVDEFDGDGVVVGNGLG